MSYCIYMPFDMHVADILVRPLITTKGCLMNTENITTEPTPRPLGYWLRAVDRLLAREFETAFHAEGISRRDWRILTLLAGDAVDPERLARLQRGGGKKLRPLLERGWVIESDGAWSLTDEGRAAQARLAEIVTGIRAKVSGAVPDEDFATTVATLEAIARELGWDPAEQTPRGSGHRRGFGHGRPGFDPGPAGFGPRHGFGPRGERFGSLEDVSVAGGFPGAHPRGDRPCHPHGEPGRHGRHGERAYERGFDAGFARGAQNRAA